jgi:hypothetical protein
MMDTNENDFVEDDPLAAPVPRKAINSPRGRGRQTGRRPTVADAWDQTKDTAHYARERTELFLRENPVPLILGALALGLTIGLAIRYSTRSAEKEIESPLGRLNWRWLSLPFLLPLAKSIREKYEESTDAVKEGVGRVRNIDIDHYTKPIRRRWKSWTH